jgi:hypothetical protein
LADMWIGCVGIIDPAQVAAAFRRVGMWRGGLGGTYP